MLGVTIFTYVIISIWTAHLVQWSLYRQINSCFGWESFFYLFPYWLLPCPPQPYRGLAWAPLCCWLQPLMHLPPETVCVVSGLHCRKLSGYRSGVNPRWLCKSKMIPFMSSAWGSGWRFPGKFIPSAKTSVLSCRRPNPILSSPGCFEPWSKVNIFFKFRNHSLTDELNRVDVSIKVPDIEFDKLADPLWFNRKLFLRLPANLVIDCPRGNPQIDCSFFDR